MADDELEATKNSLRTKIQDLHFEVAEAYEKLAKPNWSSYSRRYYLTLYGYVMYCFSSIDLLSYFWRGSAKDQTERMKDFMVRFMHYGEAESKLAVVMWRHKLMHTSEPRSLVGSKGRKRYTWLLHWHTELPREHHMKFQDTDDSRILMMSLVNLVRDLETGLDEYLSVADKDKMLRVHGELNTQEFDEP